MVLAGSVDQGWKGFYEVCLRIAFYRGSTGFFGT